VSHTRAAVDVQKQLGHAAPAGRMRPKRVQRATQLLPEQHGSPRNRLHVLRRFSHWCAGLCAARGAFPHPFAAFLGSGGGGNRTRVRGRTGQSIYKLRLPFESRPDGRGAAALPPGQPSFGLAPPAIGFPLAPARSLSAGSEPRAQLGPPRHLTRLGGECEFVIRTCIGSGFLTRPPGPRLAALPENRPRRNQVAPVCCGHILPSVLGNPDPRARLPHRAVRRPPLRASLQRWQAVLPMSVNAPFSGRNLPS
jgi:hypothetical protein